MSNSFDNLGAVLLAGVELADLRASEHRLYLTLVLTALGAAYDQRRSPLGNQAVWLANDPHFESEVSAARQRRTLVK